MAVVQELELHLTDGEDRLCVWETEGVRVMRARLAGRSELHRHATDADVVIVPIAGALRVVTPDGEHSVAPGQALALPLGTEIQISNPGEEGNVFLVVKTPNPGACGTA
jgi:mannose-6-phosphate isomerase-like protein (cupin superfamily)